MTLTRNDVITGRPARLVLIVVTLVGRRNNLVLRIGSRQCDQTGDGNIPYVHDVTEEYDDAHWKMHRPRSRCCWLATHNRVIVIRETASSCISWCDLLIAVVDWQLIIVIRETACISFPDYISFAQQEG